MPRDRLLNLVFPTGGINRAAGFNQQRPFTAPDALNVVAYDTLEGRERGGSRPGLDRWAYEELGSGAAVRGLGQLDVIETDGFTYWSDAFATDAILGAWSSPAWIGDGAPGILPGELASVAYADGRVGLVRTALANLDSSLRYSASIRIVPYAGDYWGDHFLFGRMSDSTPDAETDGFVVRLYLEGSTYSGSVVTYSGGTPTAAAMTSGDAGTVRAGLLTAVVTGTNLKVYWLGVKIFDATISPGGSGHRLGFGLETTRAGGIMLVDSFRAQWFQTPATEATRSLILATAGGTLYKEARVGEMESISSSATLASDHFLAMGQLLQQEVIADWSDPLVEDDGGDGVIGGGGGNELTAASVADWTALGLSIHDHVVQITGHSAGASSNVVSKITTIASGMLTLTTAPGAGTCGFRIVRSLKSYDYSTNALALVTHSAGVGVPAGCRCMCIWRDRVFLGGAADAPHAWYACRRGDITDWDYFVADDDESAWAGSAGGGQGSVGEPITCLAAHNDDLVLFGCVGSLYVLRGDPAQGGAFDRISATVGVLSQGAACHTGTGEWIFLHRDGVYALDARGYQLVRLSEERIPAELKDIDPRQVEPHLVWDERRSLVHIFLTPTDGVSLGEHWLFDWRARGFFRVRHADADFEPTAALAARGTVLLGSRDGYLRAYDGINDGDEGAQFSSFVDIGPLRPGGNLFADGIFAELVGELDPRSGAVTWAVRRGESAASAVGTSTTAASGSWTGGRSYTSHPRVRGGAVVLRLSGSTARAWAFEGCLARFTQLGRQRF